MGTTEAAPYPKALERDRRLVAYKDSAPPGVEEAAAALLKRSR